MITLVIDDEYYGRMEAVEVLQESGYFSKVYPFENLDAALAYLQRTKEHVHFVFCDVLLRNANGTKAVQLFEPYVDCVILFTGSNSLETREQANNSVPHGILFKPLNPDLLKLKMEQLLNPADPLKRLQVPEAVWAKPLVYNKKDRALDVKVMFKDIVYFKKAASYVHLYIATREGAPIAVGRVKTTLDKLYKKYERLHILLYANRSELVHIIHITQYLVDRIDVAGKQTIFIGKLKRDYYQDYLRRTKLLGE